MLIIITVLSAFLNRNIFSNTINFKSSTLLIFTIIFILFFSAQQSISYDEGLYHASFISWLNEFGLVKGIANTHGRLGFNSSWHIFVSVFNFKYIFHQPLNQLNGLILISTLLFFQLEKKTNPQAINFINVIIILLFCPLLFVYHIIDPSADYIVICWVTIIVYELFYSKKANQDSKSIAIWCLLSISLILTIKLSAYLLVILIIPLIPFIWDDKTAVLKLTICGIIIAATWLFSNYILSGYIIYPFVQVEPLSPKWKVPAYIADREITWIKYAPITRWANISFEEAKKLSPTEMFTSWFVSVRGLEKLLFLGSAISIITVSSITLWKKQNNGKIICIWCLVGFTTLIFTAPDFRFYAIYTFSALAIIAANTSKIRIGFYSMCVFLSINMISTLGLYSHLKKIVNNPDNVSHKGITINLLKPESYPRADADSVLIDNTKFYLFDMSQNNFAWDVIPYLYASSEKAISLIEPGNLSKGIYVDSTNTVDVQN